MITPLMKVLVAVIILYFLVTAFLKITKWTLRAGIIILVIAIFIFGYTSVSEIWDTPPTDKIKDRFNETNMTIDDLQLNESLEDLELMQSDLAELENLTSEEI